MPTNTDNPIPQTFQDLARHAARFADGVQRLRFSDERGAVVSTEAMRFASLVDGAIEAMVRPPLKGFETGSVEKLAQDIAPAVETLGHMIEGFRQDASAGLAVLPDQNDLEIGMNLLAQAPEEVLRLVQLLAAQPYANLSGERTMLRQCLVNAGVPLEQIDDRGPGTIKILFVAIFVLIIRTRPDLSATLIVLIAVVFRIDDGAKGGGKKKTCPCPEGGGDGGSDDGGGDGRTKCGDTLHIDSLGDADTPIDSVLTARANARTLARLSCPDRCPPELVNIKRVTPPVKQANGMFRTFGSYTYRCAYLGRD